MKTRINKKNFTLTITVDHNELTNIWLGLDQLAEDADNKKLIYLAKHAREMSTQLLHKSVEIGNLESE